MTRFLLILLLAYLGISFYIGSGVEWETFDRGAQLNEFMLLTVCYFSLKHPLLKSMVCGMAVMAMFECVDQFTGQNYQMFFNDYLCIGIGFIIGFMHFKWVKGKKQPND